MSIFLQGIYNLQFVESAKGHVTSMCGITIKTMMMQFLDQGFWYRLQTTQKASFAPWTMRTKCSKRMEQYELQYAQKNSCGHIKVFHKERQISEQCWYWSALSRHVNFSWLTVHSGFDFVLQSMPVVPDYLNWTDS